MGVGSPVVGVGTDRWGCPVTATMMFGFLSCGVLRDGVLSPGSARRGFSSSGKSRCGGLLVGYGEDLPVDADDPSFLPTPRPF